MAARTRRRASALTARELLTTWETVDVETPARRATSRIVVMVGLQDAQNRHVKRLRKRFT
jgi:hypothetical protein